MRASRRVVEVKAVEVDGEEGAEGRGEGEMEEGAGKRVLSGMRCRGGSESTTGSDVSLGMEWFCEDVEGNSSGKDAGGGGKRAREGRGGEMPRLTL